MNIFTLFLLLIVGLFLWGAAIAITVFAVVCIAVLAALGIVSSSVIIGVLRRRFSSGLRAFHFQVLGAIGWIAGIGVLWFGASLFNMHLREREIFVIGSFAGICAGLLLALVLDRLAGSVFRWIAAVVKV
jgi:hypothetical protein